MWCSSDYFNYVFYIYLGQLISDKMTDGTMYLDFL